MWQWAYRAQAVRVVFRLYNSPTCIPPDTAFFALNRLYTAHLHRESISLHDQYHLKPTVKQISLESRRFTQHGDRPFDLWLYAWDSHHMETAYVTCDYRPEIHTAWKPPMWLVIICLSFPPHRDRLCDLWLLAGVSHHMETAYVTCDYWPAFHTTWRPPMWHTNTICMEISMKGRCWTPGHFIGQFWATQNWPMKWHCWEL